MSIDNRIWLLRPHWTFQYRDWETRRGRKKWCVLRQRRSFKTMKRRFLLPSKSVGRHFEERRRLRLETREGRKDGGFFLDWRAIQSAFSIRNNERRFNRTALMEYFGFCALVCGRDLNIIETFSNPPKRSHDFPKTMNRLKMRKRIQEFWLFLLPTNTAWIV